MGEIKAKKWLVAIVGIFFSLTIIMFLGLQEVHADQSSHDAEIMIYVKHVSGSELLEMNDVMTARCSVSAGAEQSNAYYDNGYQQMAYYMEPDTSQWNVGDQIQVSDVQLPEGYVPINDEGIFTYTLTEADIYHLHGEETGTPLQIAIDVLVRGEELISISDYVCDGVQWRIGWADRDLLTNTVKQNEDALDIFFSNHLTKNDYTITYENNDKPGTATMIITGKNGYTGEIRKDFNIVEIATVDNTVVELGETTLTYNGEIQCPEVLSVKINGVELPLYNESNPSETNYDLAVWAYIDESNYSMQFSRALNNNMHSLSRVGIHDIYLAIHAYNAGYIGMIPITYEIVEAPEVTIEDETVEVKSLSRTTAGVKLTWSKPETNTFDHYVVYRKDSDGEVVKFAAINEVSTVSFTDKTVVSGKRYTYWVKAFDTKNKVSSYKTKSITYLAAPKATVKNVSNGIKISWKKITGATGYTVYRKYGSGKYSAVKTIKSGNTVSFTDTAVKSKSGKTYTYAVRANGSVSSAYSEVSILRLTQPSVTVKKVSSGVKISWKKVSGAQNYVIYRKTGNGSYKKLKTVKGSVLTYTDKAAKAGKTYTYAVKAVNNKAISSYSGITIKK